MIEFFIRDKITDLQNAKTATEVQENANYFVLILKKNEELKKDNARLERENRAQGELLFEIFKQAGAFKEDKQP